MADEVGQIIKALRLVPEFDGNSHVLTRFIRLCDQLVQAYVKPGPGHELGNLALLNGILNKVTGSAARLINTNGIPEDWNSIRNALINNFADHRDETALYNDLSLLTQGPSTPQEFYERCQSLFSTIMTYVSLHETVGTTIEAKRTLYQKLTLQSYLRGLKDPLGSRIRCMRPATMEKALEFVQEEMNTLYMQQRNDTTSDRKAHSQPSLIQTPRPAYNNPFNTAPLKPFAFNMPGPSKPQPMQQMTPWRPNLGQNHQFRGPTRTQQMFRAPLPNYNPQGNTFRMPLHNPGPSAPRPMSGVSHFSTKPLPPSGHDWRKFGNPPPSNYFKTREMNFNECTDYDSYYENYCDNYNDSYCYDYLPYYHEQEQIDTEQYEVVTPNAIDNSQGDQPHINSQDFQNPSTLDRPK